MSKQNIRKFRKNQWDDEEVDTRKFSDKRKDRRVERALRTKDISVILDDDLDPFEMEVSKFEEERYY